MNENQLLETVESTGITTWSFDEINLALDNLLEKYKGKVYTEESYKSAKSDKQELNAINKRIEEKRKEYKKICLAPYNAIEDEIKQQLHLFRLRNAHLLTAAKPLQKDFSPTHSLPLPTANL